MTNDSIKPLKKDSTFFEALKIQCRVIGALLMREVVTRYGRHNIGLFWIFLESMIFCGGVTLLWNLNHQNLKVEVTPFIITGYACLLLWRNCTFKGLGALEANRSLLHHRPVKVVDIFFARMLLEMASITASCLAVVFIATGLGFMTTPYDIFLMSIGWLYMAWLSSSVGIILGGLSAYSEVVERIWHPFSYFILPISGVFFMVDWLPQVAHKWILLSPLIHPIEMMRAGYWGNTHHFYFDFSYISLVCLVLSFIGLLIVTSKRMKMLTS